MRNKIILVVVLVFMCLQQPFLATSCTSNMFQGYRNFNVERYLGQWNLIGFVDNDNNGTIHRCVSESYAKSSLENPFILETTWSGIVDDVPMAQNGIITLGDSHLQGPSHWDFYMEGTKFNTFILATNYDTWALEFSCSASFQFDRFMIRSRSSGLGLETIELLKSLISGYGYDGNSLQLVDQTDCL